ncbi:MAG: polysaccharide deacetylase family protein [Bryobacterales bacterium]
MFLRLFLAVSLACGVCAAQPDRRIALTIDDLPMAQSGPEACEPENLMPATKRLLAQFAAEKAPLTAFVITSQCPGLTIKQKRAALNLWRSAGVELGNHTHSHKSLSRTPIAEYEEDILKADALLQDWTGKPVRFFRWPMLHAGATPADKQRLEAFLADHHFREAPVTFDNSDWIFANLFAYARRTANADLEKRVRDAYVPYMESVLAFFEQSSNELFGREIPQILLMHSNMLNADATGDLLAMLRKRGYRFISLEEALEDPAYAEPNEYVAANGISWLHRWKVTRGGKIEWEPDVPKWVQEAFEAMQKN